MTDDQPKVGNIVIVDAETIARVMKVDDDKVVLHALDFPFFRLIDSTDYDVTTIQIADDTRKAISQLILPSLTRDWSVSAWESEVEDLASYVLDEIEEEDSEDGELSDEGRKRILNVCRVQARNSEWITNSDGQEKCIKYSVNYLEISPSDVLKLCPEPERHVWTSLRKASALAHLVNDIYHEVLDEYDSDGYDWDEDNEDDSDD